jgi:hypothetical protein
LCSRGWQTQQPPGSSTASPALGFIRGGVLYIDRTVRGRRFNLSTGCRTGSAAFAECTRFEQDRFHFNPRATSGTSWAEAVLEFLKYQQFTQGRTFKYVEEQARHLERFGHSRRGEDAASPLLSSFLG